MGAICTILQSELEFHLINLHNSLMQTYITHINDVNSNWRIIQKGIVYKFYPYMNSSQRVIILYITILQKFK